MSFKVERLCNDHGVLLCGRVLAEREVNFRGTPCFSEQQEERRANMNEDVLKGKWKEIKGGVKEKWGKLTEDDLTQVEGNQEKLLGLLQQKYGYAKEKAEQEYNDFTGRYKGKQRASAYSYFVMKE